MRPLSDLPRVVQRIGVVPGVWLVGSGAAYALGVDVPPKDWDFLVDPEAHCGVLTHLRGATFTVNSCGGMKATAPDGTVVDVWISSLAHFITHGTGNVAVNLLHNRVVRW